MEGYLPTGVPVQRRLSRLYNDTKKSSDFVKEPVSNGDDPEIRALHRKLRIQKDRLVSWGLEWSDNSQSQSAEVLIDKSLSKAGLSEVVGSIMSTIKDILAEAEPLWQSSRRLIGERESEKKGSSSGDQKNMPMVPWDKGRFEDLVRDLTTSIDTLFDLSRTRSTTATSQSYKQSGSSDEMRAFESTRVQTPKQIDPNTLTNLRAMQAEPMSEGASEEARPREIVFMQRQAYSEIVPQGGSGTGRQPNAPLLLEYAAFDPIYSTTGIMPSMTRFEKLSAGLQSDTQRPGTWIGLPRLLGYFEDYEHSRIGLVYQFPPTFNPISYENLTQNPLYSLNSLSDLLKRPDFEPKLEAKFRLASNLANTVFDMHARGISHGNLVDTNISFCNAVGNDPSMNTADVDIRRPLVSSFDLFPDSPFPETSATSFSLYRHPLDPRVTSASTVSGTASANADPRVFDLYSLSMILLSVGLWTNLELLTPNPATTEIPSSVLEQLAIRCGTLYMRAVQACWTAADKELSGQAQGASDQFISKVQVKASRYLEACCILDGVSALEDRLTDDLGEPKAAPAPVAQAGSSKGAMERKSAKSAELYPISEQQQQQQQQPFLGPPMSGFTQTTPVVIEDHPLPVETQVRPRKSPRARLYPHVPLPADLVEQWNLTLMPEINLALQHFYKKHPESVEISLESIGESAKETRPTVLVVCTSVAKVRGILKKRLGYLFDGTTNIALKVCKGQMLRSRKTPTNSSLQHGPPVDAANGEFQERPGNGASIGAWIGDQHLPPASLGGIVIVDDKPYGMTVHHMLDDPDAGLGESTATQAQIDQVQDILRSSVGAAQQKKQQQEISDLNSSLSQWYADLQADAAEAGSSSTESEYACEFSDTGSEASGLTSDYSESDWGGGGGGGEGDDSDEEKEKEDEYGEPGDIPGVELGCGEGYIITQPAFDDVGEGFYPNEETADEDHLDTCALGEVHASSGIRRRTDEKGLVHEIDWALIEFDDHRAHQSNLIPSTGGENSGGIRPTTVVAASALPGLHVQCIARTSGLQSGRILPTIVSVKIYGRQTASHSYQISSTPSLQQMRTSMHRPMGIPGDSGAWIIERGGSGRLCGHVLAWSDRKRVAYLCPMDMLLLDMAETLEAAEVRLPGGDVIVKAMSPEERKRRKLEGTIGPSKGFALMIEQPQSPLVARQSSLRQQDFQRQSWGQVMDMKQQKPIARANTGFTVDDDDVSSVSTAGGHPNPMHMAFQEPVNVPPLTPLEIRSARHFRDSGVHDTSASPDKTEMMNAGLRRDGSVRSSGIQATQSVDPFLASRFGEMHVGRDGEEDARFYARG
ncbi:hypothetical protein MCOR06_005531 [Pyricularia oryzae]|nr:hypothetical protein MCOR06_005531 [Pyricularia oryzae]